MSFLTDIKERFFTNRLRKDLGNKTKDPVFRGTLNLRTAGRITILFTADNAADRKIVDRWRDRFATPSCKIDALGFFPTEVGKASFDMTVVSVKSLNWYGIPQGPEVDLFLKKETDLLIRLGARQHRELDYLAALKPAALKIGPQTTAASNPYHLRYDVGTDASPKKQLAAIEHIFSYTNAAVPPTV